MKLNGYVIVGIVLIALALATQIQASITDTSQGGVDTTPPEYDITYMIPANGTSYYIIPESGLYPATPFAACQILARDLESGIQSVTMQIWGLFGITYSIQVNLMKWRTYASGWEAWTYNWTKLNLFPSPPTEAGAYSFYFTITNNAGISSALSSFGRWRFYVADSEQPVQSPGKGDLEITMTINGGFAPTEQALFQITGPLGFSTTQYGNTFLLSDMPTGTYQVNGTYYDQVQVKQAVLTSGERTTVGFDFQSVSSDVTSDLPKTPIAYNAGELIPSSQILPFTGVALIIGAVVLVMGLRKKTRPG